MLPTYKPRSFVEKLGPDDPCPKKIPYFYRGKLYYNYSSPIMNSISIERWKSGKGKGPKYWFLNYIIVGNHPNITKLPKDLPEAARNLYTSVFQLRLITGKDNSKGFTEAFKAWNEYNRKLSGKILL